MNTKIKTDKLSIGYEEKGRGTTLLHEDIKLELMSGEFTCLLGPNGAGKSTLIRTFAGFQPSLEGAVFIEEKQLELLSEKELSQKISVVLTERTNIENMTVSELVSMGRFPYTGFFGSLSNEDKAIVNESIESVGISRMKSRMLTKLSDGERQKAMIAKALAQQTSVIILDEPTAFLDLPSRIEIMRLLHHLAADTDKAILLSTHDLELALQFADRIWLMGKNKQIKTGVPEDLILNNHFKNFFERDGIIFDNYNGAFKTLKEKKEEVMFTGNGICTKWAKRALERNGYIESEEKTSEKGILVNVKNESCYEVYYKSELAGTAETIENLIQLMKGLNLNKNS